MTAGGFFIFLNGQENETKESYPPAMHHGLPLQGFALLTIGGVCGTRCAQTATDPTSADGCDARPVTKGQMDSPLAQSMDLGWIWLDLGSPIKGQARPTHQQNIETGSSVNI
jgi:hypothetical protein